MKTLSLILVVAILLLPGSLAAQVAASGKAGSGFRSATPKPESMLFEEIVFDDLPIRSVVEYLRQEKVTSGLNFIVAEEIEDVPINLQLRRVSFDQLATAIEIASGGNVAIEAVTDAGNLYHVRPGKDRQPRSKPVLRVFNLSRFLVGKQENEAQKALKELSETVDMAFTMLANAQRAAGTRSTMRMKVDTKFHPGTKLMIVIGDPADVEVFHEVVSQLTGESRPHAGGISGFFGVGRATPAGGMDDMDAGAGDGFGFGSGMGGGAPGVSGNRFPGAAGGGGLGGLGGRKTKR